MTKAEKKRFIRDLVSVCRNGILAKVDQMPEEWDGIELRQLIADTFKAQCSSLLFRGKLTPIDRRRRRDYDNEVLVRNLV